MSKTLKLLLVEDSEDDAKLVLRMLQRGGFDAQHERVESATALKAALAGQQWDAVISDFRMPGFTGLDALKIFRSTGLDIPFILVSGTIGEEIAVDAMKAGASDYVMKKNLARLAPALERELKEAAIRAEHRQAERDLVESEAGLRRAQLMASLAHVITGPDGAFESWSETLPTLIGVDPGRMPKSTRESLAILHPEDRATFREKAIAAGTESARADVEYRLRRGDGAWIHVRQVMEPLVDHADAPGTMRWFNTLQDVTAQKQAEERIRRLNRIYAVLSGINALIVRVRDREELFREACRIAVDAGQFRLAWIGVVDRDGMQVTPVAWSGNGEGYIQLIPMVLAKAGAARRGLAAEAIAERRGIIVDDMTQDPRILLRKEAQERGFHSLAVLPLLVGEEAVGVLALYAGEVGFFDADEMKLLHELAGDIAFALDHIDKANKVNYLAYYDSLTGLANRTLLHERLAQFISAARDGQHKLALVLLDIERFKTINDSLGRHAGDALLKQMADRLQATVGEQSQVARVGADHFAIVIPKVKLEQDLPGIIEDNRRRILEEPFEVHGTELRISTKAGVALFPRDGADADTLFRNAEAALTKAKASGEPHLFYTPQMTERSGERLTLENQLRQALENEEFILHYQSKVDSMSGAILGVEALIRWNSAELGLVPPMKFIPLMEETGLILEVGAWALQKAVQDHSQWLKQGLVPPRIAVNVSPIQLRKRDFVSTVVHALKQGAVPPGIDLEITESVIMEDIQGNIEKLKQIRNLGVSIAIDDFGTGYSSLGYLAKLPVQTLKIDRSFIITMLDDPDTMSLVSTIISLAHSLKLKVVAEGVDAEEQAKFLRLLRCDEMQGYLFSRPLPIDEITPLLSKAN